jgi:hypothetical protein
MAIVRRIRPENDIARPIRYLALWRYAIVSNCYVVLIVLALIVFVLLVLALTTDITALNKVAKNEWPLTALFVSSGGLGAFLVKAANREQEYIICHRVLDDIMGRPQSKANDKMIQDVLDRMSKKK